MATWYTHGTKCDKRWKTHRAEHCPACHETFSGTQTADAHRVGVHGVKEGDDRRRCLTPQEVRVGGGKKTPGYPLKWNEAMGYWSVDRPDNPWAPVATVRTPFDSSAREVPGTSGAPQALSTSELGAA